jgi:hypothetical protein
MIVQKFEEQMNSLSKGIAKKKTIKKDPMKI